MCSIPFGFGGIIPSISEFLLLVTANEEEEEEEEDEEEAQGASCQAATSTRCNRYYFLRSNKI